MAKVIFTCSECGSNDIRRNADVAWNVKDQHWEIAAIFDYATCECCGAEEVSLVEKEVADNGGESDGPIPQKAF